MLWNYVLSLFGLRRITPVQLYKVEMPHEIQIDSESLKKGAERQWKRLHVPDIQTKEMLEAIERAVPRKKNNDCCTIPYFSKLGVGTVTGVEF